MGRRKKQEAVASPTEKGEEPAKETSKNGVVRFPKYKKFLEDNPDHKIVPGEHLRPEFE